MSASRRFLPLLITLLVALSLVGTGCQTYVAQSKEMTNAWATSNVALASKQFCKQADDAATSGDAIIWNLEAGAAQRANQEFEESNRHLGVAGARIDKYEEEAKVKVASEAGAIMSNQQNLPYTGRSYDKIMLHTYTALNLMAMGQIESARPELLRAYQCQQDAVDENARRIEAAQKEADASKQKQQVEKARSDKKMNAEIDNVMSDLEGFTFYADYVNPFTVYLDGLYFLYAGVDGSDLERATKSLKRVQEIAPDNKFLQVDLATAEAVIGGQPPTPTTYVIFETGQAASRDQIRIDIPIIVTSVSYVGVAFPRLAFHPNNETALTVQAGDVSEQTQTIANMDAIVALDFKNEWPVILTKTMVSTIAKGVAAYAANEAARQVNSTFGLLTRIGTAIAQASVNIADTRTWSTLPREIQMARVATPPDRTLTLSTPTGGQTAVTVGEGTINLVYVKSISAGGPMMLVNQFKLK